eukprot:SAG11_NODE_21741_length_419_cov_1.475000_1_plen_77_part_01
MDDRFRWLLPNCTSWFHAHLQTLVHSAGSRTQLNRHQTVASVAEADIYGTHLVPSNFLNNDEDSKRQTHAELDVNGQ